jgi:transposase
MIKVEEKENIRRLYFIQRQSIREIARELHASRKTVRKAVQDASVPQYRLKGPRHCPVIDAHLPLIESWLKEDQSRPPKQRHTAHRIYARLVSESDYKGSERTVREHVSRLKGDCREMAIPLEFDPGADAHADWGESLIYLNGQAVKAQVFCLKLGYSGKPFVMAFPTQRQEAFFEGHRQAFEWFGGVPARISYDNLTVAVQKVLRGRNRIEQQAFIALRSHYLFDSHFALPATPREQGRVESLVGYSRRNYLVPVPEVDSFEELNQQLQERLRADDSRLCPGKGVSIGQAWEEEKGKLLTLPRFPYPCCIQRPVKSNHLSLVNFDNNHYSVPVEYGLKPLTLKAYAWQIEIACGDRLIATHRRSYEKDRSILEVDHYLPLLMKRPGAFPYAKPVRQMPEIYQVFLKSLAGQDTREGVREFLHVLSLGRVYGRENLELAMQQAVSESRVDLERIRQLVCGSQDTVRQVASDASNMGQVRVILPDLSQYDRLRTPAAGGSQNA